MSIVCVQQLDDHIARSETTKCVSSRSWQAGLGRKCFSAATECCYVFFFYKNTAAKIPLSRSCSLSAGDQCADRNAACLTPTNRSEAGSVCDCISGFANRNGICGTFLSRPYLEFQLSTLDLMQEGLRF